MWLCRIRCPRRVSWHSCRLRCFDYLFHLWLGQTGHRINTRWRRPLSCGNAPGDDDLQRPAQRRTGRSRPGWRRVGPSSGPIMYAFGRRGTTYEPSRLLPLRPCSWPRSGFRLFARRLEVEARRIQPRDSSTAMTSNSTSDQNGRNEFFRSETSLDAIRFLTCRRRGSVDPV